MQRSSSKSQSRLDELKKYIHFLVNNQQSHSMLSFACNEVGIPYDELLPVNPEALESTTKEINDLRVSHMEARRKAKINILAKFLLEKQTNAASNSSRLNKSNLTPTPGRMNDSQFEAETERKVKSLKKAILNELSVSQKLKRLKKEEEDKKRKIEEKIKEKEAREIIKLKNHKLFEIRDERIKEILQKKKKEEEEHEIKGLQYSVQMKSKEKLAGLPSFHTTPQHQHTRSSEDLSTVTFQLDSINQKLHKSAKRAKKLLLDKKIPAKQVASQIIKVKTLREQLLSQEEEEKTRRILRLQNDLDYSSKRRELLKEQKKLSRSLNSFKSKKNQGDSWLNLKEKETEKKNQIIDKIRKDVKEGYSQKSQIISMKIALRKKDQEENLQKILHQQWKEKDKLIEKLKEDSTLKRPEINFRNIRAEVKKEFFQSLKKLKNKDL